MSPFNSGVCENVRDVFLLLDDISGRGRPLSTSKAPSRTRPYRRIRGAAWRRIPATAARPPPARSWRGCAAPGWTARQIGPEMPSAPITWPVKSVTGTATQRTSGLNSPSSKAMPVRLTSAISRNSTADVGDRLLGRRLHLDAVEKTLQLIGAQRGQDDLAERGAMRRAHHADAVGQLKRAGAAGARDHHDGVAHAHRKMAAFAGFARQLLENGRRDIDHLDLVERAGGEREQRPADAVSFCLLLLAHIAQRNHGLGEMERGGIVQADQLAQFGKPDAFAVARDLFEDRKGAAERLDADRAAGPRRRRRYRAAAAPPAGRRRPCADWPASFSSGVFCLVRALNGSCLHATVPHVRHRHHNNRYSGMTNANSQCRIAVDSAPPVTGNRRDKTAGPTTGTKRRVSVNPESNARARCSAPTPIPICAAQRRGLPDAAGRPGLRRIRSDGASRPFVAGRFVGRAAQRAAPAIEQRGLRLVSLNMPNIDINVAGAAPGMRAYSLNL